MTRVDIADGFSAATPIHDVLQAFPALSHSEQRASGITPIESADSAENVSHLRAFRNHGQSAATAKNASQSTMGLLKHGIFTGSGITENHYRDRVIQAVSGAEKETESTESRDMSRLFVSAETAASQNRQVIFASADAVVHFARPICVSNGHY